jgi:hypothetical protein
MTLLGRVSNAKRKRNIMGVPESAAVRGKPFYAVSFWPSQPPRLACAGINSKDGKPHKAVWNMELRGILSKNKIFLRQEITCKNTIG